jgi:hypothetical protein
MTQETEAIEVEVVQIDGITPPARTVPPSGPAANPRQHPPWQNWQDRIRHLDSRWWPLWGFLGILAVFLLLTVGVVLGTVYLILRIIGAILRWIAR